MNFITDHSTTMVNESSHKSTLEKEKKVCLSVASSDEEDNITPTKKESPLAFNAGLSELSRQLRIFQAKNEVQSIQISRLERQLKILVELQGISVGELRDALTFACEKEANAELNHIIAMLRAQLEAAKLTSKNNDGTVDLDKDASAHHTANLELRVGELEEVEEKLQQETRRLYKKLSNEKAKKTNLEATIEKHEKWAKLQEKAINAQDKKLQSQQEKIKKEKAKLKEKESKIKQQATLLKAQEAELNMQQAKLTSLQQQIQAASSSAKQKEDAKKAQAEAAKLAAQLKQQNERNLAEAHQTEVQLQKELKEAQESEAKLQQELEQAHQRKMEDQKEQTRLEEVARQANVQQKVEHDKLVLATKQLEEVEQNHNLRKEQFDARFKNQDARITDLEQQLSSLYTAFTMLRDERRVDEERHEALRHNLDHADAVVARQVDKNENKQDERKSPSSQRTPVASFGVSRSPVTPSPMSQSMGSRQSFSDSYQDNTSDQQVLYSTLLVRSGVVQKRWRRRGVVLLSSLTHFYLDMGDGKKHRFKFGVSTVEEYRKRDLAFRIDMDPQDPSAPVIYAAALNVDDYTRWMTGLTRAITGNFEGTNISKPVAIATGPARAPPAMAPRSHDIPTTDQEASDLERALMLSLQAGR